MGAEGVEEVMDAVLVLEMTLLTALLARGGCIEG